MKSRPPVATLVGVVDANIEGSYRVQNAALANGMLLIHHVADSHVLAYAYSVGMVAGGFSVDYGLEIVRAAAEGEEPESVWTYSPDDAAFAALADAMRRVYQGSVSPELN